MNESALRRERRIGWIITILFLSIMIPGWIVLKVVIPNHRNNARSMAPAIHRNDRVFINHAAYAFGAKPKVDDVVMYRTKEGKMLHRIVAGPGDTIEMREEVLFLNGKKRFEPHVHYDPEVTAVRTFGPVKVPAGHYFLLGDNRNHANDSRFTGLVAEDDIRGRMFYVLHTGECMD